MSATSMLFATSSVLPNDSFNNIGGLIVSAAEQSGDGWLLDDTTGRLTITTNGGIATWCNGSRKKCKSSLVCKNQNPELKPFLTLD
ncbi:MAG: hypothetical protein K2O29_10990 [Ruminococcus sp.]|nr:hypothetical protein [Ruminococcus sp.]